MMQVHTHLTQFRWFASHGVRMAGERKQREIAQEIVGDNVVAEKGAFSFPAEKGGGEIIKEVPFVFVPNLIRKVADVVAEHERYVL